MEFSVSDLGLFRNICKERQMVIIEGANFMGDRFKTSGLLMTTGGYGEKNNFMNKDTLLLYQGQSCGVVGKSRRPNYLVVSPNFDRRHALCVEKVTDEFGNVLYLNKNFDSLYQDISWENRKLLGVKKTELETEVSMLKKFIGKPVVVNGEKGALLAVSNVDSGDGRVVVCVRCGDNEGIMVCRIDSIQLDESALETTQKMVERFNCEKAVANTNF